MVTGAQLDACHETQAVSQDFKKPSGDDDVTTFCDVFCVSQSVDCRAREDIKLPNLWVTHKESSNGSNLYSGFHCH